MAKLGYNFRVLEEGVNDQNVHPRKTPFHGETLKHVLFDVRGLAMVKWFNEKWGPLLRAHAPGRTRQYIRDGMKIEVPPHLWKDFQGAGRVKNPDDMYSFGYKVVWLQEIIDRKGVLVSMKIAPIETHDLVLGRELVEDFSFEEHSSLVKKSQLIFLRASPGALGQAKRNGA